jgi:hypothetical protein
MLVPIPLAETSSLPFNPELFRFEIDNRRKENRDVRSAESEQVRPRQVVGFVRFDRGVRSDSAAQPGYAGSVVVDLGRGRRFALNLWDSIEHSQAALSVLVPEVDRLLGPLMSATSEFIGAGEVISSDLARRD